MIDSTAGPSGSIADPDHPGWLCHDRFATGFAAATGKLIYRPDGPARAVVRIFPGQDLLNPGGSLHGGAVMSFIDMALFTGGRCAGVVEGHYVTLDLTVHFVARGRPGIPLDAHVELIRQTRSFAFLQGVVWQDSEPCYTFAGTLKRVRSQAPEVRT